MNRAIKTTWEYSSQTEVLRILNIAHAISNGFIKLKNWLLIPYGSKYSKLLNAITFPDLPYHTIPRFWEKALNQVSTDKLPIEADPELIKAVSTLLEKHPLPKPNIEKLQSLWERVDNEVFEALATIIPGFYNKVEDIVIEPTVSGAWASFDVAKKFPTTVRIYLREDAPLSVLVWSIISDLTRNEVYTDLEGSWEESQILADWLVKKSTISSLLAKYELQEQLTISLKHLRSKQDKKAIHESQEFCKRLGLSTNTDIFAVIDDRVTANGNKLEILTFKEKSIMRLLIDSKNKLVDFDEIGSYIFDHEDDFSLWAIAKFIQRLRDKLEKNGISGSFIQTVRGQGYILRN